MYKWIFFLKLSFLFFINLQGFNVVVNNFADITKSQKIQLTIDLDSGEGIYSDYMHFLIDHGAIKVRDWKTEESPRLEYVPSFRQNRKIYFNSFDVDINLDFLQQEKNSFKMPNLYLSCLLLDTNGKTKPKYLLISLNKEVLKNEEYEKTEFIDLEEKKELVYPKLESQNGLSVTKPFIVGESNNSNFINKDKRSQAFVFDINENFLLFISLILFFISIHFLFPSKNRSKFFTFFVGVMVLSFALSLIIKICLINNWWPFFLLLK
jgi:hypothetical protein